jgi:uncharacterized protein (DUF2336 family)
VSRATAVGLDTEFLQQIVAAGSVEARKLLAHQIAVLLRDEDTPLLEREQVIPVIEKLAVDREVEVRTELFGALRDVGELPADVVFSLAASEDDLAMEFIRLSVALDAAQMMAVLKVGDAKRQAAVACRPDISQAAVDFILEKAHPEAVLAIFDNIAVELRDADYRRLYGRFALTPQIMDRLLDDARLPSDVRVMQARRVSSRMRQYLAEMPWTQDARSFEPVDETEELTMLAILEGCRESEASALLHFMADKDIITPSLIIRACCIGRMTAVVSVMAHLTNMPRTKMRDLMFVRQGSALRSALLKSGLPPAAFAVFTAACDLAAAADEEGIEIKPFRFGRRLIEELMSKTEAATLQERHSEIDLVSRYADTSVRTVARKLKTGLTRAA